jgi:hypothetical protein
MRNFTQFIRDEKETRLDVHCYRLKAREARDLSEILGNLGFTFCYANQDSILAFKTGEYSQVKDIMQKLKKFYGFEWAGKPLIWDRTE